LESKTIKFLFGILILTLLTYTYSLHHQKNFRYSTVFYRLGMECEKGCSLKKRLYYFQKAVYHAPLSGEAYFQLANTYERMSDHVQAFQAYRKALELDHTNHDAALNLGVYYFHHGQKQMAWRYLNHAYQLRKDSYRLNYYLGRLSALEKDYEMAMRYFDQANLYYRKPFSQAFARMGAVYELMGQKDNARKWVGELKLFGEDDLASKLEEYIDAGNISEFFPAERVN